MNRFYYYLLQMLGEHLAGSITEGRERKRSGGGNGVLNIRVPVLTVFTRSYAFIFILLQSTIR